MTVVPRSAMERLGLAVFLTSLGVLFAASLVAYFIVRTRAESWRPADSPPLPAGLWPATVLLAGVSGVLERVVRRARSGRVAGAGRGLVLASGLALGFLACQVWNWTRFAGAGGLRGPTLHGFTFYMLTGLHALHVLGGLGGLAFVALRTSRGAYSWAHHEPLRHTATYWHFLGVVWVVLLGVLLFG